MIVCLYLCMHAFVDALCMSVCVYERMRVWLYVQVSMHKGTYVCIYALLLYVCMYVCMHAYIHSLIHSRIWKAPLQETYLEAPPAQPRRNKLVLSNLRNAFSLFLGSRRTSSVMRCDV